MAPCSFSPSAFKMALAATTSSTGSAVSETRTVSPMPSSSRAPKAAADFSVPIYRVPASVTPRCKGKSVRWCIRRYAWMLVPTSEDFRETQMSSNPQSSSRRMCPKALSTNASAVGAPYLASSSRSSEPPLTPMRMGIPRLRQASATARTRSGPPMLPGLMRILSAPSSATAKATL